MVIHGPSDEIVDGIPHVVYDEPQIVLFDGKRGKGKTHAMRRYVDTGEPRVFNPFDLFGDFPEIPECFSIADAISDLGKSDTRPMRRRFVPTRDIADMREFGDGVFRRLWESEARNYLLVIDEVTRWADPNRLSEFVQAIVLQGRRLGIRIVSATQALRYFPRDFKGEVTDLVIFKKTFPRDLEVVEEWTDKETRNVVRNLRKTECVYVPLD